MLRQPITVPHIFQCLRNALQSDDFRCRIRNTAEGIELTIFGEIDGTHEGDTVQRVVSFLSENRGRPVHVLVNSPGGSAFSGIAVYNALLSHNARVTVTITGVAASAGAIIAAAGDPVRAFDNSTLMIHRALMISLGNVDAMREAVSILERLDTQIASTLAAKSGKSAATMLGYMVGKNGADGTWFDAGEALKVGLVDKVIRRGRGPGNSINPRTPPHVARALAQMERDDFLAQIQRDNAQLAGV